jgi:fumarate hydratase class I
MFGCISGHKNPIRASMIDDQLFDRRNKKDNTPAVTHVEFGGGHTIEFMIAT